MIQRAKKKPNKSNTKIFVLPPSFFQPLSQPFQILCVYIFVTFQRETQPEHKEIRGLKAPKKGGFRHGILGEIFVFGCLFRP